MSSEEIIPSKYAKTFDKRHIFDSKISISKENTPIKDMTENQNSLPNEKDEFPSKFHSPAIDFYESTPLILKREFNYQYPKSNSAHEPDRSYFTFDKSKIKDSDIRMKDAISHSPPLVSIFPKHDFPVFEPRVETNPFGKYPISYFSLKFSGFMPDRFIEPIFVNVFLWDWNTKRKITETWRFFVEYPNIDSKLKELFNPIYNNSPKEVVFPKPFNENQIYIIVHLDRLLYFHNGSALNKYYEKTSNKILLSQARSEVNTCNHKEATNTFAWSAKPLMGITSPTDETSKDFIKFQTFYFTQSVNDNYIAKNLNDLFSSKKSDKGLQTFQVWFDKGEPKDDLPHLLQYFDIPRMPYMHFVNTLIIHPISAHFKFPRGLKGRNIFAEIRLYEEYDKETVNTEKPLQLFNNGTSDVYVTRYQYHVEHPYFNEEIIIHLPVNLPLTVTLKVDFIHASLKKDTKQIRQLCGAAVCPLANSHGAYIGDGEHSFGISYTEQHTEKVEPTNENQFTFSVFLRSSVYPSSRTIASLFQGKIDVDHFDINEGNLDFLMVHLYPVLDILIDKINQEEDSAFDLLLKILAFFKADRNQNEQSQILVVYINKYAFRHYKKDKLVFSKNFTKFYLDYLTKNAFSCKRDDFYFIWFMFELLVKAIIVESTPKVRFEELLKLTSMISGYLPKYRNESQEVGLIINKTLALFYKDLFEIPAVGKGIIIKMVNVHLSQFGRTTSENQPNDDKQRDSFNNEKQFDREWLRTFFEYFVTPKIFIYLISPIEEEGQEKTDENKTLFNKSFLPIIESELCNFIHTNEMFKLLYQLLLFFDPDQYPTIAKQLNPLLFMIGRNKELISMYESKEFQTYIFVICHFILYYSKFTDFTDELGDCCSLLIKEAIHTTKEGLRINDFKSSTDYIEDISRIQTKTQIEFNLQAPNQPTRKFVKHKKQFMTEHISKSEQFQTNINESNELLEQKRSEYLEIFDSLAFCIQCIMASFFWDHQCVQSLNAIVSNLLDVEISPLLMNMFNSFLELLVKDYQKYFMDPRSNVKHIFKKLFQFMDAKKLKIIEDCYKKEKQIRNNTILTDALIAQSLYKVGVSDELLEMLSNSSFKDLASELYEINKNLDNKDLKVNNYDVYSDLLFQKAELLTPSPDARVFALLELADYHSSKGYVSEAVVSQITAAALVAEYLTHLKRIPRYFNCKNPVTMFCIAAPSANSEICPDEKVAKLPNSRGFCSSKYFNEYGLICLLLKAIDTCKKAQLYEVLQKFNSVLTAVAEYRHLWQSMSRYYMTGSFAWEVINSNQTSYDRDLGKYYCVRFMTGEIFIYRQTNLENMWQVGEKLKKSATFYSNGKEIVIVNEGEDLNPETFQPDKFYIHVKSVSQYFTPEELKKRVTVFEQNYNISRFYFDIPLSKSAQASIENCSLKRTIITVPHPFPYIVKRVRIPKENIKNIIFSPIEYSSQNVQMKVDQIEEACARRSFSDIQALIQGALLTQVNEGPAKIAEVFLGAGPDSEQRINLRNIFRKFIDVVSLAVKLHAEYVKTNPVWSELQEKLESGLNSFISSLQPYLT